MSQRIPNPFAPRTLIIELLVFFAAVAAGGLIASAIGAPGWPPAAHAAVVTPPLAAEPSTLDRVLDVIGPIGKVAVGGMACLAVAWLLSLGRARWGWLRKGAAGNAAATVYAALVTFGAVLAIGGDVGTGLAAVGGAMVAGMGLAKDPETARLPRTAPPEATNPEAP